MLLRILTIISGLLLSAGLTSAQQETFATLRVGSEVFSNVTVFTATATHITFSHSRGITTAKLKNLEPSIQQLFHFDPRAAAALEAQQARENFLSHEAARKPAVTVVATNSPTKPQAGTNAYPLLAKSFLNQPAPQINVENWITDIPDTKGKFVLLDIWATWCGPCRRAIPHLNELQAKYRDRLAIIGLSDESIQDILRMTDPPIDYAVASDTQGRTSKALEVKGIPHLLLIDPNGIVRFQGLPHALPDNELEGLLTKYASVTEQN